MSADGQSYVERYSPYMGATYSVHLRLGLLSNDAHNYRVFCGDQYLADKCRCSVGAVKRAKAQLIKDGFLRVVFPAVGRQFAEYELVFKGVDGVDGIASHGETQARMASHRGMNSVSILNSSPTYRNKDKRSETSVSQPPPINPLEHARIHAEGSDHGPERARQLAKMIKGGIE